MSEVAPAGGGPNRIFIVIALGLVGLLVIGIVVFLLFLFVVQPALNASRGPVVAPTRAVTITFATTPTRAALVVFTPTVVVPTDTPQPTLVVQPAAGTLVSGAATTPTVGTTGTPGSGLPQTGLGEDLLMLAGGVVLVFVFLAARHARTSTAA
jgi:hypothetical protein